jgi:pyruvate kinase
VDHRQAIIAHPRVDELRFNTISPLAETRAEMVARLRRECRAKKLWLDLKGRQLRITKFAYLPYAYVELSHRIAVGVPCDVHFRDGVSRVAEVVGGNKLILNRRPTRVVGEGEPVNILDDSLVVDGYLTESDKEYVAAARAQGLHAYMLSFAEGAADIDCVRAIDPEAELVAKIESRRGLAWVDAAAVRLMAARDDLYVQLGADKAGYVPALERIVKKDPSAIVASRILESLETSPAVSSQDIADLELMLRLGFTTFMLSDSLCFHEASFQAAMDVLARVL